MRFFPIGRLRGRGGLGRDAEMLQFGLGLWLRFD